MQKRLVRVMYGLQYVSPLELDFGDGRFYARMFDRWEEEMELGNDCKEEDFKLLKIIYDRTISKD